MSSMFKEAICFNSDISKWNVSNVTNMGEMFNDAPLFNSDISSWNVSRVYNMCRMFKNASSFKRNLNSWKVRNLTTGSGLNNMFENSGVKKYPPWYKR